MQFSYGDALGLRLLDEANFWKHQEYEHTTVIREMIPNLERKFVEELKEWEHALTETHGHVVKLTETAVRYGNVQPVEDHVLRLISFCVEQSGRFIKFLFELLSLSPAVKSNPVNVALIKHQIRESEYFVGIAQTICGQV